MVITRNRTGASRSVTFEDAVLIVRRVLEGETQHSVAAAFGINQGRVSEIVNGYRHPGAVREALRRWPHLREEARRRGLVP